MLSQSTLADATTLEQAVAATADKIIPELNRQAALLPLQLEDEMAIDWFNGRRTPDANALLKGAISGLTLGSDAPKVFKAIAEATCFGAKAIVDRFTEQQIPIQGLIGMGGVAKKSPFVMQMMADVLNMPIRIHRSEHTCALGAAMFAATSAGIYNKVEDAMQAMGQGFDATYFPNSEKTIIYNKRYQQYKKLGNFIEQQTSPVKNEQPINGQLQTILISHE
jgi:L-ribulokinase